LERRRLLEVGLSLQYYCHSLIVVICAELPEAFPGGSFLLLVES
jgi:hypothetical protein